MRLADSARWGWAAAVVAGAVWLLVWAHQAYAHGTTQLNEKQIVLGLTWMDSGKFLVVAFALLLVSIAALRERRRPVSRTGRAGLAVATGALVTLVIGAALEFWTFPWGSYAQGFDEPLPTYGGLVQTLASVAFAGGTALLALDLCRRRALPIWLGLTMVIGALTTIYLTPVLPLPGVAWLLLGVYLWWSSGVRRDAGVADAGSV